MAVRIRKDGRILCAALHPEKPGDIYVDDELHYQLSVELHLLVTESAEQHMVHGQWWWYANVPEGIEIDEWWKDENE